MATGAVLVENRPDIAQVAGILQTMERDGNQRDGNQPGRARDQAHTTILRRGAFPENQRPAGISFRQCRWLRTGSWARSIKSFYAVPLHSEKLPAASIPCSLAWKQRGGDTRRRYRYRTRGRATRSASART